MRVLLDTAVLLFSAQSPEHLTKKVAAILADPENTRELSAVSISEIAIKSGLGKLQFSLADLHRAIDDLCIQILPYTRQHAFRLFDLPLHHTDPFDRQLIAQALQEEIPVITIDKKFRLYENLEIIW